MEHCEEYLELISASLDGELSEAEQAKLETHLAQCSACARLRAELSALSAGLSDLRAEPPEDLTERIMARIAAEEENKIVAFSPRKQWRRWGGVAAVLAVVLLGAAALRLGPISGNKGSGEAPMAEAPMLASEGAERSGGALIGASGSAAQDNDAVYSGESINAAAAPYEALEPPAQTACDGLDKAAMEKSAVAAAPTSGTETAPDPGVAPIPMPEPEGNGGEESPASDTPMLSTMQIAPTSVRGAVLREGDITPEEAQELLEAHLGWPEAQEEGAELYWSHLNEDYHVFCLTQGETEHWYAVPRTGEGEILESDGEQP